MRSQVLAIIRQAIVSGEMAPGVVYSTPTLAAQLSVSSAPVREAMLALADDGLLEALPNRGFRVVPLRRNDLEEIVGLRMILEVAAAGQLAEQGVSRVDLRELRQLAKATRQHVEKGSVLDALESDREFHLRLVGLCGNGLLLDTVARLRDRTRLYNLHIVIGEGRLTESATEHDRILDAVAAHDRQGAEVLVRRHLAHILTDWVAASSPAEHSIGRQSQRSS
jgi:DNA-binding GntR family transcriptional regulator